MDVYNMILESYNFTAYVFAHIIGFFLAIVAAVAILAIAAIILAAIYAVFSAAFDGVTARIARRMAKKGTRPKTKAGRAILGSLKKQDGSI